MLWLQIQATGDVKIGWDWTQWRSMDQSKSWNKIVINQDVQKKWYLRMFQMDAMEQIQTLRPSSTQKGIFDFPRTIKRRRIIYTDITTNL